MRSKFVNRFSSLLTDGNLFLEGYPQFRGSLHRTTGRKPMHEFTPEQACRWDAWQNANAVSARRSDRVARLFAFTMLTATLMVVAVAVWR